MARIRSFEERSRSSRANPTQVDCGWHVVDADGETLLQLDTYGSDKREIPGKVSQTLQVDEGAAGELIRILQRVFPRIEM